MTTGLTLEQADTSGSRVAERHGRRTARTLAAAVRAYQAARSGRPTGCRYVPSCSEYAVGALEDHGAVRGTWLALRRLLRCGPWGGYGPDPVPERGAR